MLFVVCGIFSITSCSNRNKKDAEYTKKIEVTSLENKIERGKYLVETIGCNDCHSPKIMSERGPIPDPDRLLSGHDSNEVLQPYDTQTAGAYVLFNMNSTAVVGPWGTSFSANLTPDATGLGTWSEEQFLRAMKQGKYKGLEGSRQLLPPMPWPAYAKMPDEDIKAIFTFLKSIKPIKNLVPQAIPPGILVK